MRQTILLFLLGFAITWGSIEFGMFLERHDNKVSPIEDVVITLKRHRTALDLYIATHCPNEFGRLQEFLDCLEDVKSKYEN